MTDTSGQQHGSLVALEGHPSVLATQCRLLPSSPDILVLPELEHFMTEEHRAVSSLASRIESYVLAVHNAYHARAEKASLFLKGASSNQRRLVFMNGGIATAYWSCIMAISEHRTRGDTVAAEQVFNALIRDGVEGLERALESGRDSQAATAPAIPERVYQANDQCLGQVVPDNRAYEAMQAAEALDRKTESLQPTTEIDLTFRALRHSRSLPLRPLSRIPESSASLVTLSDDDFDDESSCSDCSDEISLPEGFPYHEMPNTESAPLEPGSDSSVVIGEAFVVDVRRRSSRLRSARRGSRFVDSLYANRIRNQDISLCTIPRPSSAAKKEVADHPLSDKPVQRPGEQQLSQAAQAFLNASRPPRSRNGSSSSLPTRITSKFSSYEKQLPDTQKNYVHQGTCTENNYADQGTNMSEGEVPLEVEEEEHDVSGYTSFTPVLPMVEGMVIYFRDEQPDLLLEHILRFLKMPSESALERAFVSDTEDYAGLGVSGRLASQQTAPYQSTGGHAGNVMPVVGEYDPFASHGEYPLPPYVWTQKQTIPMQPAGPPTPAHTPPPRPVAETMPSKPFYDIDITTCRNAVEIQDCLRQTLGSCFSPDDEEALYRRQRSGLSFLPDLGGGTWEPVFRKTDPWGDSGQGQIQRREIDLILAIGAEREVDREFTAAAKGSLEKLGVKAKGITRSGRLDLRYLILNAMKAAAAQPFPGYTQASLATDACLLATLVLPCLETYMAVHTETRFLLLEYQPEHVPVILALQELLGNDLLKTAGIFPDKAAENNTNTHSHFGTTSPSAVRIRLPPLLRANFALATPATESEIAAFITAVWRVLVDRSSFYIPDGPPRAGTTTMPTTGTSTAAAATQNYHHHNHNLPLRSAYGSPSSPRDQPITPSPLLSPPLSYSPLDRAIASLGFQAPISPPFRSDERPATAAVAAAGPARGGSSTANATSTNLPMGPASIAGSSRTARVVRTQKAKLRNLLGKEVDAENGQGASGSGSGSRKSLSNHRRQLPRSSDSASFYHPSDDEYGERYVDDDNDYHDHYDNAVGSSSGTRGGGGGGGGGGRGSSNDEDAIRFSADERRYMPQFVRDREARKVSSRKALKFLGLSTEG